MAWFSKTAGPLDMPPVPTTGFPPKAPGAKPPMPKGPMDEKKDVMTAKEIEKAIKALVAKEKGEQKEVKLLEEAGEKLAKFIEQEDKESKKEKKDEKPEPKEEKE